ncbi:protein eyes shut homolog, partial [Saccostrea cucullata]|uniref:protein eyes shut homolog n=1 Tax=Saccostrea cuccullata TaxID=36930 RepID=UPI002ED2DF43
MNTVGKRLCDPSRGQCHGCVDGRSGLFCETEVVENNPLTETTSLVIAVVILSLFIILMVVVFLACVLKRKCQSSHSTNAGQDYETTLSTKDKNLAFNKTVTVSKRYNKDYFAPSKVVDGNWSIYQLQCALTASGQKEALLTIDLGENKNVASITMVHGTLGFGSYTLLSSDSGLRSDSDGEGPVQTARPSKSICKDSFDEKDAQVVCLAWGSLPDNPSYTYYEAGSLASIYEYVFNCEGNEVNMNRCPKELKGCSSMEAVAVKCKRGNTLSGFSVYVSDTEDWRSGTLCYQHDIQQIPPLKVTIDCVTSGRYITFYNTRNLTSFPGVSEFSYIAACEIAVNGCDLGFYGVNCTQCPKNCLNNSCHFQTGECVDCVVGYTGASCETACSSGNYGQGCAFKCGNCFENNICNKVNGSCPGQCSPGWIGDKCDRVCVNGYFGLNCGLSCNIPNCKNSTSCDVVTGECLEGCIEGLAGKTCNECEGNFYGERCNMTCSKFCKDGVCIRTTGQCRDCIHGRSGFFCETKVTEIIPVQ